MKTNNTFQMTYSAQQQDEIQSIREKYIPKEENKLDTLRALDAKATSLASITAILMGVLGALIMGIGMSLIMTDFGTILGSVAFPLGIVLGVAGMGVLALAYPLYSRTLKKQREKIAPEILRLSDELLK